MAKVTLRASGGLNYDIDPNNLPDGDYVSASNIIVDTGKDGGAGAMRMIESIKSSGVTFTGTVKTTFQDPSGYIYVLVRTDGTTAKIYRLNDTQTAASEILNYPHAVSSDFTPDLRIIGDMMVWNYYGSGTVLSYSLKRYSGGAAESVTANNLFLQKKTPNNVVSIAKVLTSGAGVALLEQTDVQFSSRYQYQSGEYSVLSNFSQMYKAEKNTSSYTITFDFSGTPSFVSTLEVYCRFGNNGTWRRIETRAISLTSAYTWSGQIYETLDTITAAKPFDAVPVNAKHLEVAKNRLFLANIQDDYEMTDANKLISISTSSGTTLSAGSTKSYLGNVSALSSSETSSNGSGYAKPFANNSTYAVGWAYYDESLKTRGVEKFNKFTTGKFTYPILPDITLTQETGYSKPSWAKYIQVVYTKNISKSYVYEGYASNIYFQFTVKDKDSSTGEITNYKTLSQNITKDDLKNEVMIVVDLMGMFRAGAPYVWQDGDRMSLSIVTDTGTGATTVLDLTIANQVGSSIYCKYTGGVVTADEIPDPSKLYFEIYTPAQQQSDDALMFYEYGNLVDITGWSSGSITFSSATGTTFSNKKLLGDMVFTSLSIPTYKTSPFLYNVVKTTPIESNISADQITVAAGTLLESTLMQSGTNSSGSYIATPKEGNVKFTSLTSNADSATLTTNGASIKLAGFYEAGRQTPSVNVITLDWSFNYTDVLSIKTATYPDTSEYSGKSEWRLYGQIYRVPYDNKENKPLAAVKFDTEKLLGTGGKAYDGTTSSSYTSSIKYDLNKIGQDFNAKDEFYIKLRMEFNSSGDLNGATSTLSSFSFTFTLNGDRITPKTLTSYNPNPELYEAGATVLFRSISNATVNKQWNTSSGKPTLSAKDPVSLTRTNAIRYSGNFVAGTKINNLNSFFGLDANEVPIENGDIMSLQRASRLQGNGSMLLALCKRESSYIFLGEQELAQGNNNSIRALTANFIGTIRNMGNMLGLQDKGSVMNYKGTIWWWDNFNKKVVKYDESGIDTPSDLFMRSSFISKDGTAKFAYDPFYQVCYVYLSQNGGKSLGFSDKFRRWISFYDFNMDFAESFGDKMILFKNGTVYKSLQSGNQDDYNSLMGTTYNSTIQFVLNSQLPVRPLNVSISHNCNVIDYNQSNGVKSSLLQIDVSNENGQASQIYESNFLMEDNRLYANVMRDSNSTGGLVSGDYVVGYLNKFLVTLKDRTQNMKINSVEIDLEAVSGHS